MDNQIKQAKQKALSLLNYMDRTEAGLRQKLQEKSFGDEAIDQAIEYVKSFGYINDVAYAERYISSKKDTKSQREIYHALSQKGIRKEDISFAMESCYEVDDACETIRRLCAKKRFVPDEATETEKNKMYGYLMRKGFRHTDVCKVLKVQ